MKGDFEFEGEEWLEVSEQAKDLIRKLICKPELRLTAEEALQHEWIRTQTKASTIVAKKLNKINIEALKKFQHHQKLK
jgi:calcium-dependent protein kinase